MAGKKPRTDPPQSEPDIKPGPQTRIPDVVPVIGSGATVIYPSQMLPVLATEEKDIRAIDEAAVIPSKAIGIFAQKPIDGQYQGDLYSLGTAATISRMAKNPDGSAQAILQGVARIRIVEVEQREPICEAGWNAFRKPLSATLSRRPWPATPAPSSSAW